MAHWAEIDENNVVLRVTVGDNNDPDEGYQWLIDNLGGQWVKTSYNGIIRKQYAGIGFTYDEVNDVFVSLSPYPSWVLDELFDWQPPISRPEVGTWLWDEESISWVEQPFPSWTLIDEEWTPPTPRPENGNWIWDEPSLSWIEMPALPEPA